MASNNIKSSLYQNKGKKLAKGLKRIETAEKKIDKHEKEILKAEKRILEELHKKPLDAFKIDDGLTPREAAFFQSYILRKISKHKLIFALVVTVGTVLIWRGIWHSADELPIISSAFVSLIVGIGILWLVKKYTDLK